MWVSVESSLRGQVAEQQAFSLVQVGDPGRVYCLGVEAPSGVLVVWLDPDTGKPTFGCYPNIQDAVGELRYKFGSAVPLELVMDERPADDVAACYAEVVLAKAMR